MFRPEADSSKLPALSSPSALNGTPTDLDNQMLVTGVDSCSVVLADVRATADTLIAPQRVVSVSASTRTYLLPVACNLVPKSVGGLPVPISADFIYFTLSVFWESRHSNFNFGRAAALPAGREQCINGTMRCMVPCTFLLRSDTLPLPNSNSIPDSPTPPRMVGPNGRSGGLEAAVG